MATIGKVTVNTPSRTTIVSQNFKAKPNVALSEVAGVDTVSVTTENGFALVYNSDTGNYEPKAVTATVVSIQGGRF
tara:strand:+ start:836 stop:1063 length:228 start_codon:yes stop_codon:yes gene_type:complete